MDRKYEVAYKAYTMSPAEIVGAIEEIVDEETRRLRSQRDELLAAAKRMVGADTCDCYLNDPLDPECAWCQLSKAISAEADNAE